MRNSGEPISNIHLSTPAMPIVTPHVRGGLPVPFVVKGDRGVRPQLAVTVIAFCVFCVFCGSLAFGRQGADLVIAGGVESMTRHAGGVVGEQVNGD